MAWKKRIGKICRQNPRKQDVTTILNWPIWLLESCLSTGKNESRHAGVVDKHYFSVAIKRLSEIKAIHHQLSEPLSRRALRDLEQST